LYRRSDHSRGGVQSGSGEQRIGEGRQYSKLGSALERGIVAGLAGRAAFDDRGGFVDVGAPDVYRSARYVAVSARSASNSAAAVAPRGAPDQVSTTMSHVPVPRLEASAALSARSA
jgi:hypothetical protein